MNKEEKPLSQLIGIGMFGGMLFPIDLYEKYWNYPIRVIKCLDNKAYQVPHDLSYIRHDDLREYLISTIKH